MGRARGAALAHSEKVVSIVEANQADLDKAAKEVEVYVAANKTDIGALNKEFMALGQKVQGDPEASEAMMTYMNLKLQPLDKRIKALDSIEGFKEHEDLQEALSMLSGGY